MSKSKQIKAIRKLKTENSERNGASHRCRRISVFHFHRRLAPKPLTIPGHLQQITYVALLLGIVFSLLIANPLQSQENPAIKEFHRKIFVPFESLEVLLDGNSNRVLLTRVEYEELLKSARTREIKRAPFNSAVVSANYSGKILDGVAMITGELIVEPLNAGLVQVPLPFSGVAIRSARLGDQPAKLWRNEKGEIVLLTSGELRETLTVEMTVPLQTSAARQSLSIQLPAPAAAKFSLNVPGNVEVKSGASVVDRTYNEQTDSTSFDLLATREAMNIVMSLNNRLLKDDQVIVARSVLIHKLTPHLQEMHVTCSLDVIHGALEEMEFDVPDGFQISQVSTELLSQWEIKDVPVEASTNGKRLVVKLRQPTREDVVLSITASRSESATGEWQATAIRPVGVAGNVTVVGVLADVELKSSKLTSAGVIAIDHEFLLAAIPATLQGSSASNPVTVVAAYYAPQSEYSIAASFSVPAAELIVKSNSRLVIDNQQLELQGGVSLISRNDSRFGFKMSLPKGWRLNELTDINNQPVRFDRLGGEGIADFQVHLPTRIPTSAAIRVFFKASLTPAGWLEKWESTQINFPVVKIEGQSKHTGAIAVASEEDLAIKPVKAIELELLDEADKKKFELDPGNAPLAYQFENSNYQLDLELERLKPAIIARTYNYFLIRTNQLSVHTELIYDVKQANEGEFKFDLPLNTPKSISIQANEYQLKDYSSEELETARRWTFQLAKPRKGIVHLLVDYQMPLEEAELAALQLTPVIVRDVNFQSSMVAIEGSSEMDIAIETNGRAVDVGEFAEAVYQPGRHMLGAYSWPNEKVTLAIKSLRRPIYQLPSAIVQRAEMATAISTNGKAHTAARFQLVTKQQPFLRIELPKDSTLWSVQLDGQSAKPQRQGDALLISLMGNETGKLRDLQLVFESPASSFNFVGTVQANAPTLWLNESGEAKGLPVPLVDLHWRLILPDGFSVSHSDGKFQSDQLVQRPSPIQQLGYWIYRLGGGIGEFGFVQRVQTLAPTSQYFDSIAGSEMEPSEDPFADAERQRGNALAPAAEAEKMLAPAKPQAPLYSENEPSSDESGSGKVLGESLGKKVDERKAMGWALSGLRSLNIELTDTGNSIEFYNLGEQPTLSATIVNQSRLNWVAISLSLLIAALGVLLTHRKFRTKVFFVMLILVGACLVPLAGSTFDAFRTIIDLAILAAVFVTIYFVLAGLIKMLGRAAIAIAARIPLVMFLFAVAIGFANQAAAQQEVNDVAELKRLLIDLQTDPTVKLPDDAIIIPFNPADPDGREKAESLLLPYEHYLDLINKTNLDRQPKIDAPVGFVLAAAEYKTQLTLEDDVSIVGKLVIELLTDEPVAVVLPLFGGALADARVDGKPAKLQFATINDESKAPPQQNDAAPPTSIAQLHLEGRGTKVFEFTVRMKPARQGGWRMVDARLPVGLTRGLNLTSLSEPTEIRLNADADQRSVEAKPNQEIATVLSADGSLRLQWKPSTATQTVDQSLTANSEAIFDIREDGLRLTWRVALEFRGSERDVFTLNVPDKFLVEQVSGENIRSWDVKSGDANPKESNRLNVTLLRAAKDKESFTIELSRRDFSINAETTNFDAPYLSVEGAALHNGVYSIRRSPIIELKTAQQRAANRIDENQFKPQIDLASIDAKSSPLGIEPFQVLQFLTTPFQIGLQANLVPRTIKAETQSILRIGQSQADLESRINIKVGSRPIYELSLELPLGAEIRRLSADLKETWTSETVDGVQRIQFFFPAGVANDFSIILEAGLTEFTGGNEWTIPKIKINEVDQQTGFVAIQVDPALSVTTSNLQDCETVLLQQIEGWLNADQRTTTRLSLRTKGSDYKATLRFTRIQPRVSVETVTNVRTTFFAIEETVLLDFNIQQAGIRQIQFELPVSMRNAHIMAKLVSETIIEDIADNASAVLVTLNLQDEVIDSYRVVIENDRQLSDSRHNVPIPRVLTGTTEQRFATLQNAGRDEINVLPAEDFQPLNRQLNQFAQLRQKLSGGELTMAYVAQPQVDWPVLQFESKQREVFDTVAASIEFSKTTMVVDSSGAYRALQNFQVNNRSEQYLEIELPVGAQLLTVSVEGQPVKPVAWPTANNDRRLRIPLVKTPLGDLDFPVVLKYAGQLGDLENFNEVEFPVVETLNINVQLSQLHLRLPDSHRWLNFGGTMTKVDDRGELEESYLSYKSRQIQQLAEQIQNESSKFGSFSKSRAYKNLQVLEKDMRDYASSNLEVAANSSKQIKGLIEGNNEAIRRAQQVYSVDVAKSGEAQIDNRANFNQLLEDQTARIARNSVTKGGQNFRFSAPQQGQTLELHRSGELESATVEQRESKSEKEVFDGKWLEKNKLNSLIPQQARQGGQQGGQANQLADKSVDGNPGFQLDVQNQTAIVAAPVELVDSSVSFSNSLSLVLPSENGQAGENTEEVAGQTEMVRGRGFGSREGMVNVPGGGSGGLGGSGGGEGANGQGSGRSDREPRASLGPTDVGRDKLLSDPKASTRATTADRFSNDASGFIAGAEINGRVLFDGEQEFDKDTNPNSGGAMTSALTSLDIELPSRGVDFFFKSPRGRASVIVRPIETRSFSRWTSAITTLAICVGVWLLCWFVMWLRKFTLLRVLATGTLLVAGLVSLAVSFLPIYGLIAIAAAVVLFVDWLTHFVWSPVETA